MSAVGHVVCWFLFKVETYFNQTFLKLCRLLGATIAGLCNKLTQLTRHITRALHTHTGAYSGGGVLTWGEGNCIFLQKNDKKNRSEC